MNLQIDQLNIELPANLGGRKHSILRLLRSELLRLEWPEGRLEKLSLGTVAISSQQTNLSIARTLALNLQKAAQQNHTTNTPRPQLEQPMSPQPSKHHSIPVRGHSFSAGYQGGAA